jgi:hypothetical protein
MQATPLLHMPASPHGGEPMHKATINWPLQHLLTCCPPLKPTPSGDTAETACSNRSKP